MEKELLDALNKMGKGWFVLKVAEDAGLKIQSSTYYGKKTAMNARLTRYEKTIQYHKDMIKELEANWSKRITGGNPTVSNSELLKLAKEILN